MKLFNKSQLDKINNFLFDSQIKHRFKPNNKQKKLDYNCKYCGKKIQKQNGKLIGVTYWADGNGNISDVACINSSRKLDEFIKEKQIEICPFKCEIGGFLLFWKVHFARRMYENVYSKLCRRKAYPDYKCRKCIKGTKNEEANNGLKARKINEKRNDKH